jgi:hypothetical protein
MMLIICHLCLFLTPVHEGRGLVLDYLHCNICMYLLALPTTNQGKDIVFRFIIEYSSLRDFGP